ncbi:MAG TPA: co-chaperone GroES [Bacteroidales bacterium]|nr:co-chaperone GroES [Bacteroidales bacterium]
MTTIGKPMPGKVLIEPVSAEEKTSGGIIIPDSAKEKPSKGKIVAIGKEEDDNKSELNIGDTVLYGKYSGTELQIDEKDYLILNKEDILLVIK